MMAMVFPNGRVIFIIRSDFQTTCSLDMDFVFRLIPRRAM